MPVTLISTKALFENEGIRTYFNDELWLALPDGDYVRFIETRTNYTLQFIDDADPIPSSVRATPKDFPAAHALTLREPLAVDWDLAHMRMVHFSPERILASEPYVTNFPFDKLRDHNHRDPQTLLQNHHGSQ